MITMISVNFYTRVVKCHELFVLFGIRVSLANKQTHIYVSAKRLMDSIDEKC